MSTNLISHVIQAGEALDRQRRWRATTSTWLSKCVALLQINHEQGNEGLRWLAGDDAGELLQDALDAADSLVPLLNDGEVDEYEIERLAAKAKDVARALRARSLAPKLAATGGRTPEEAEAYAQKARDLQGRST